MGIAAKTEARRTLCVCCDCTTKNFTSTSPIKQMKTMYTGLLVLVINLGTTLALTTIDKRLEFNSATKEATLIGVTMLISYAAMVAGRRILPSLIGHGKQGVQGPVPPAGSPEDEPPECLKQQLRDIQERMEYNALIATAAASDDIANMHKVLRRMLELDVKPNKVTFEHFFRTLLRQIREREIEPNDAAQQADALMQQLEARQVQPDMHTFQLLAKIFESTGSQGKIRRPATIAAYEISIVTPISVASLVAELNSRRLSMVVRARVVPKLITSTRSPVYMVFICLIGLVEVKFLVVQSQQTQSVRLASVFAAIPM